MTSIVIDLITPPTSPVGAGTGALSAPSVNGDSIDLCTPPSSPTAAAPPAAAAKRPLSSGGPSVSVKVQRQDAVAPSSSSAAGPSRMEEDEVLETAAPPAPVQKDVRMADDSNDDDVTCTGRTGDNALLDFPHARENCVAFKFVQGQESKCCDNCYCYVCDAPAKDCPEWEAEHCKASHTSAAWQQRRAQWKARLAAAAAAKAAAAANSAAPSAAANAAAGRFAGPSGGRFAASRKPDVERWSCDAFYTALLQVYPKEEPQPAGLLASITLRPYQKQSLAFMIDLERSTDPGLLGIVTYKDTHHRELTRTVRGGFLCDEMGMGKTAVVTALCLANPHREGATSGGKAAVGVSGSSSSGTLKLTMVIVQNTLVKQWEDEVKKFAPQLRVHALYNGAGDGRTAALANLHRTDVLITTPHASWPNELLGLDGSGVLSGRRRIHRLIVDESHLLSSKSWKGLQGKFLKVPATYVWCVTGTPFSAGLSELDTQTNLIGQWTKGLMLREKISTTSARRVSNEEVVTELKKLMIRHAKSQRIGGEVALALPDADCQTVWLEMSADEKMLYDLHACYDGKPTWSQLVTLSQKGLHKLDELEKGITRRRDATCHAYTTKAIAAYGHVEQNKDPRRAAACAAFLRMHTKRWSPDTSGDEYVWKVKPETCTKYKALVNDMAALRQAERNCKVVVFTARSRVQQELVALVNSSPQVSMFKIFEFNNETPPLRRHRLIHDFQHGITDKPCVFVVTFESAAVGITLTAATRVYLMEPALDPAQEAQAAGRIHRLGQTKEIHIKRFAFKASIDEAIASLHDKIKSGAVKLVDRGFPPEALQHFVDHGVARPHRLDMANGRIYERLRVLKGVQDDLGLGYPDGRLAPFARIHGTSHLFPGVRPPDKFGFTYKESLCTCCGRMEKDEDSLEWFGTGNMSWLHGIKGKVADDPHSIERKGTYAALPERPRDAAAAAALFGNDPSNDAARKATLRRLELIEADDKIEAAKSCALTCERKVASIEKQLAAARDDAGVFGPAHIQSLERLRNTYQNDLADAKRVVEQAKSNKQKLSGAGSSSGGMLLR